MTFIETLSLRPEHGYCVFATLLSIPVNIYGAFKVSKARKLYDVKYPRMYVEKDGKNFNAFNCVQRAHQNFIENIPFHYMLCALSSIYRPKLAAMAIAIRSLGFIAYIRGYSTGDPSARLQGGFGYIGFFTMIGLSFELGYKLLTSK